MKQLTVKLAPRNAPELAIEIRIPRGLYALAAATLCGAIDEEFGPFEGSEWFEVHGSVLEHLGQAFSKLCEGENPATVERRVMGDDDADFDLTVSESDG